LGARVFRFFGKRMVPTAPCVAALPHPPFYIVRARVPALGSLPPFIRRKRSISTSWLAILK
jgi:hypothetical protein